MHNLKYWAFLILVSVTVSSCAQTHHVVKNSYGFFHTQHRGIVKVDKLGNDIQPGSYDVYRVYIETAEKSIQWTDAIKDSLVYTVDATEIKDGTLSVGIAKQTQKPVIISAAKGNALWQLQLIPSNVKNKIMKSNTAAIVINGMVENKKFSISIGTLTEISKKALPQ